MSCKWHVTRPSEENLGFSLFFQWKTLLQAIRQKLRQHISNRTLLIYFRPCLNIFNTAFLYVWLVFFFPKGTVPSFIFWLTLVLPIDLQRCSAPSPRSAVSKHCDIEAVSVAYPEFLYSVLKRTWDVALNWPFSGMDLKAKTAKTWKPWLFVGLKKSFVPVLLPLEKGDVELPKLPVKTLRWINDVNWYKEEWGLCWVCSSPVLVIDLSMIVSKTTVSLVLSASLVVKQQIAII